MDFLRNHQYFILHFFPQGVKLRFKILMKQNYPLHGNTMLFKPYVVKYIFETHFLLSLFPSLGNISALQALLNGGGDVCFARIFGQVQERKWGQTLTVD